MGILPDFGFGGGGSGGLLGLLPDWLQGEQPQQGGASVALGMAQQAPGAAPAMPSADSPGIGDRLHAALMGFANATAPTTAVANLIGGLATGQRQDPAGQRQLAAQQAQRAGAQYVAGAQDIDPQLKAALLANPALAAQYLSARALHGRSSPGIARAEHQGVNARLDGLPRERPYAGRYDVQRSAPPGYDWADVKGTSKGLQAIPHSASKTRVNALESGGSIIGKPGETIVGHGEWQTLPNGARIRQVK